MPGTGLLIRVMLPCAAAAALGAFGWQSAATLLALPLLAPLWAAAPGRLAAGAVAAAYYFAGSSVLPATWAAFFGEAASRASGVALWLASAVLLALPWALLWPPRGAGPLRIGACLLLALLAVSLPPLGVFGWLNPLLAAGSLFPAAGWAGLAATALAMVALAVLVRGQTRLRWPPWRRRVAAASVLLVATVIAASSAAPAPSAVAPAPAPRGWLALDTALGRTPDDYPATLARQVELIAVVTAALDAAPQGAIAVLLLPEQAAGRWSAAQQAVWARLFAPASSAAAASGVRIVLGAAVAGSRPGRLRNALLADPAAAAGAAVLASSRQPVPISMWRPGSGAGYEAHWRGTGVTAFAGERVLWSICYEDYLVWPFLLSFALDRPTVIVSLANGWWVRDSGQDRLQALHVHAWGRLFGLPVLRAVNR